MSQQVAGGYAHDKDHDPVCKRDAVDEDRNGKSEVRISQTNAVGPPSATPPQ